MKSKLIFSLLMLVAFALSPFMSVAFAASSTVAPTSHMMMAASASPTPVPPTKDIVETAAANGGFKTLIAALKAAGLDETLKGAGPFTVFAPTDQAFAKLPKGTLDNLLKPENKDLLKSILLYHVASGELMASDVASKKTIDTVQGEPILVSMKGKNVMVDNAMVKIPDVEATNGVIHAIDTVMLPPNNIADTAAAAGNFKTLLAAIKAAGLEDTLNGKGPFTVFAPTDQAFAKLPKGTLDNLLKPENKDMLKSILLYHVVSGELFASDVASKRMMDTVAGEPVVVTVNGSTVKINDATVKTADILTSNGVIHAIDKVILPPAKNIADTAAAAGNFKTLLAAIKAAGLEDTLNGKGPFTVFAPTDQAFAKLPKGTLENLLKPENKDMLKSILLYHVASGELSAADVASKNLIDTVNGEPVVVTVNGSTVKIGDATVKTPNVLATNGVIHAIDKVILPPTKNIADTAAAAGNFKTLLAAIKAAGLEDTLNGKGPFTVFAPTDQAFAKLPKGTLENLLKPENKDMLKSILLYHVASGELPAAGVASKNLIDTVNGEPVVVTANGTTVKIGDATVKTPNVLASNGIIHAIDKVILPPSKNILDAATADGRFKTLLAAIKAAGLTDTLNGKGPFTVFAPTDQAFAKLPKGTVENLLKPENLAQLKDILTYHVASGEFTSADLLKSGSVATVEGKSLPVTGSKSIVKIGDATLVISNILTSNGIIQVIDTVLIPPK